MGFRVSREVYRDDVGIIYPYTLLSPSKPLGFLWDLRARVCSFKIYGLGFKIQGLGFRI